MFVVLLTSGIAAAYDGTTDAELQQKAKFYNVVLDIVVGFGIGLALIFSKKLRDAVIKHVQNFIPKFGVKSCYFIAGICLISGMAKLVQFFLSE